MSIKLYRALACDGTDCPNISINVLLTIDVDDSKGEVADWQGWKPIPIGDDGIVTRHLCPECVASGNPLAPVDLPINPQ